MIPEVMTQALACLSWSSQVLAYAADKITCGAKKKRYVYFFGAALVRNDNSPRPLLLDGSRFSDFFVFCNYFRKTIDLCLLYWDCRASGLFKILYYHRE